MKFFLLSLAGLAAAQSTVVQKVLTVTETGEFLAAPGANCAAETGTVTFKAALSPAFTYWDDFSVAPFEMCVRLESTDDSDYVTCPKAEMDVVAIIYSSSGVKVGTYSKNATVFKPTKLADAALKTYVQCLTADPVEFTFEDSSTTLNETKITVGGVLRKVNVPATTTYKAILTAKSTTFVMNGNAFEKTDLPTVAMLGPRFNPYAVIRKFATCDSGENPCTTKFTYKDAAIESTTRTLKVSIEANKLKIAVAEDGYRIDTASAPGPCDPTPGQVAALDCGVMKVSLLDGKAAQGSAVQNAVLFSLIGALFV